MTIGIDRFRAKRVADRRREHNEDLADLLRLGLELDPILDQSLLFFPPRPIIRKDSAAMARVYENAREPVPYTSTKVLEFSRG